MRSAKSTPASTFAAAKSCATPAGAHRRRPCLRLHQVEVATEDERSGRLGHQRDIVGEPASTARIIAMFGWAAAL
ncbi:hypothetical protein [Streptomyces sp. x-19]|uniref:hypothetical protein n=1 Tax=Streptomyces sp. x-19 TaxID=2789280 RepID=UPI00397F470E